MGVKSVMKDLSQYRELMVALNVNGTKLTTLLVTPKDLENLAYGYLAGSGCLNDNSITDISVDLKKAEVNVTLAHPIKQPLDYYEMVVTGLNENKEAEWKAKKPTTEFLVANSELMNAKKEKGLHGAFLVFKDRSYFAEDISRHCAIDKAIGYCVRNQLDISKAVLFTTGRIGSDLMCKAHVTGLTCIASIKYPSDTCVDLAKNWGIQIISYAHKTSNV